MEPRVTVLMPVFNGAAFVTEAVESILGQSYPDFELLVIDDGSTDKSAAIVLSYDDPRIRLVKNGHNLGLIASLNRGLDLARGEYVARMDADDISRPRRLARQVAFLDSHPEVGVCGSWVRFFPDGYVWKLPPSSEEIRCRQFNIVGVAHPSVMLRRGLFLEHGLYYDPAYLHLEDFELWGRALAYMQFANIQEVLLDYRVTPDQVSSRHRAEQLAAVAPLRLKKVLELGVTPSPAEQELHEQVVNGTLPVDPRQLDRAERWLLKLQAANRAAGIYDHGFFSQWLLHIWFSECRRLARLGACSWRRCLGSRLWSTGNASPWRRLTAAGAWTLQGLRHV
ncbi:glycosyltransferase family 2 protein [Geomonas azotofigens]|uniref:glycosyltransferase family 2 protein n=1 Tax=Geomonas azotofigens TaxID=2843196 RepID=UPI001C1059CD|nr:glycosyltransferase family 2 protein [Geomonas azotofigens]MBU5612542.1 glycosyltransferase [Geomonas azotofigens]